LRDEAVRETTREISRLAERGRRLVLGIVRQFDGAERAALPRTERSRLIEKLLPASVPWPLTLLSTMAYLLHQPSRVQNIPLWSSTPSLKKARTVNRARYERGPPEPGARSCLGGRPSSPRRGGGRLGGVPRGLRGGGRPAGPLVLRGAHGVLAP
jgi:hypothetical protein